MREFLQGYKGSTRKFMTPVSESKFNADVMEFKDTNAKRVPYQMANKKGYATSNNDVISLGDGNLRYGVKRNNYTLSDFSEESTYYQLNLGLDSTDKLSNFSISVNTVKQAYSPNGNTETFEADFNLVDNYRQVRLYKKYAQNSKLFGIDLTSSDSIQIEYQLGRT
jgi:hypothetical protein|tara:strand:- start:378 stop:875 length:498 start_codon:yes stop_codon:yes gene_type:complete